MSEKFLYEPIILWAIGRAASGKSTFANIAEEECKLASIAAQSFSDEKLLFKIIDEDTNHEHHYHPYGDKRFLFKTNYPFDEGIRQINMAVRQLLIAPPEKPFVTIIELARGRSHGIMDVSFARAFSLIDPNIIGHSHFFYIQSSWNQQLERNRARGTGGEPHTPESVMLDLYSEDDFNDVQSLLPFEVVENTADLDSFKSDIRLRIQRIINEYMRDF